MSRSRVVLGQVGENLACDELQRRGYSIVARRYRRRGGEIDIIARDGPTMVFVEVKMRRSADFGSGADAVNGLKQRRLIAVASDFLVRNRLVDRPCRFDVVSIVLREGGPEIEVYTNAFEAGAAR